MSSTSTPGKRLLADGTDDVPNFDDPQDLVNAVISALQSPEEKTYVSMNYSNEKNLATEVQAYAKIAGSNWTFYVKSLAISIGRNTDNQGTNGSGIDIDLGPAKVVSRQHATITYNLDLRCWELKILGRNGAKVDGHKVSVETPPTPLHSGAILDIGGTQMMFILPDSAPSIDKRMSEICLARYKSSLNKQRKTSPYVYFPPHHTLIGQNNKTYQMLEKGQLTHSPSLVSASSLQSNLDQDLSKEDAKDIKPPYSYATMITQAILSNPDGVMSLSEIYNWISSHYAYYKYSKTGWQNSIRHNLSLNKAFEKVPRRPNEPGKGMKWQISESYKDEFLNKVQNGSLLKARRGSSVSRQLQLHLATHQSLPESGRYYHKDSSMNTDHLRNNSVGEYGHSRNNSLPKITAQPMPYSSGSNQMQYFGNNQNPTSNGNGSYMQTRSFNYQPQMMYNIPPSNNNIGTMPEMQATGQKNDLSSPLRQLNDIGSSNTPKLPKVGGGNNLYNLPPPPVSHTMGTSAPQAHHSRQSSYNQVGDMTNPHSFNATNQSNDSAQSNQNSSTAQTTATSDLGLGFTSPKKVAPLEAFTPERGSKNLGVNKLGIPANSVNQSSPAFWNFVQFSTPNGQTPMRKNSDEMNGEGSPTMNRKTLGGNPENHKDISSLKSSVDNSPIKADEE